jgi:ankyrin repeat protein
VGAFVTVPFLLFFLIAGAVLALISGILLVVLLVVLKKKKKLFAILPGVFLLLGCAMMYPAISIIISMSIDLKDDKTVLRQNENPLVYAVAYQSDAKVEALLKSGADPNEMKAQTALALAVDKAAVNKVRILLDHGADVDLRDRSGQNPLETSLSSMAGHEGSAYRNSYMQVLQILLDRGAKSDWTDRKGMTALMHATSRVSMVFHSSIWNDVTVLLFKQRSDVKATINQKDLSGKTALMWACSGTTKFGGFDADVIQTLLDNGADKTLKNNDGKTALELLNETRAKNLNDKFGNEITTEYEEGFNRAVLLLSENK